LTINTNAMGTKNFTDFWTFVETGEEGKVNV
jgi:hypothetical protein